MTPSRRDDTIGLFLALGIVVGTIAVANLVPGPQPVTPASTRPIADVDPTCLEWTDGCIVCARTGQDLACSTPGAACVRREGQCLRR